MTHSSCIKTRDHSHDAAPTMRDDVDAESIGSDGVGGCVSSRGGVSSVVEVGMVRVVMLR